MVRLSRERPLSADCVKKSSTCDGDCASGTVTICENGWTPVGPGEAGQRNTQTVGGFCPCVKFIDTIFVPCGSVPPKECIALSACRGAEGYCCYIHQENEGDIDQPALGCDIPVQVEVCTIDHGEGQ